MSLPGWALDLATDGVDISSGGRGAVVLGIRRVMLSAHRHGVAYSDVYALLTDTRARRLAAQIALGRGGRAIPSPQRDKLLRDLWQQTQDEVEKRPAWNRDDAISAIAFIRDHFEGAPGLRDKERAVVGVVLDLAEYHGTTRPAVPSRVVAHRTGLPLMTANDTLRRLSRDGEWLRLVQQGNRHTRRASLYLVAPPLLNVWGASPPTYGPPTYDPPTYGEERHNEMANMLFQMTDPDEIATAARAVAELRAAKQREAQDASVRRLKVVTASGESRREDDR